MSAPGSVPSDLCPTGEPILIRCEGSGCTVNASDGIVGMCAMCGQIVPVFDHWSAEEHQRDDIIARLKRGDFT